MKKILLSLAVASICCFATQAQNKKQAPVASAVAALVKAMETGDRTALEKLSSEHLSYGHSGGHVENKAEFVEAIASGMSDFLTIEISRQSIDITGKNAIVRHQLDAKTMDKGKPGEAHLNILYVFRKENGEWKMLARQAAKILK
jgi:ketosteroid isomerase-like protein